MQCMLNHSYHWKIQTALTLRVSQSQEDIKYASRIKVCIVSSVFVKLWLPFLLPYNIFFFLSQSLKRNHRGEKSRKIILRAKAALSMHFYRNGPNPKPVAYDFSSGIPDTFFSPLSLIWSHFYLFKMEVRDYHLVLIACNLYIHSVQQLISLQKFISPCPIC